jgi:predicted ATP-dependent endonuclease of OLD family
MENMKVIEVNVKNFKSISDFDMMLKGKSVFLVGENGTGKTSLIQAIWNALSAKGKVTKPLKDGEQKGNVIVVIGNDSQQYTIEKRFVGDNEYLEVTSPDGFTTTKKTALESLVGNIDFDIFEFIDLGKSVPGKRQQVEIVKAMLDPKELEKIEEHQGKIKEANEKKNYFSRRVKELKPVIEEGETVGEIERVDVEALRDKLDMAENNDRLKTESEQRLEWINNQISDLEDKLAQLKQQKGSVEDKIKSLPDMDLAKAREEYEKGLEQNKLYEQSIKLQTLIQESNKAKEQAHSFAILEDELKTGLKDLVAKSKIPIKGLTFEEDCLMYNGLPFDDTALSTSELIQVGIELAIAQNPNVKILKIARGESIGKKRMAEIRKLAEGAGFQLFVERVNDKEPNLTVKIMEDK